MVVRLLWLSLICAQKPKSAVKCIRLDRRWRFRIQHTELDVAFLGKQNVVRLDVSMNDALGVKMLQAVEGLEN